MSALPPECTALRSAVASEFGKCVSLVVVNYCTRGLLANCLSSLRQNTDRILELIVVDNHSSDDSVTMLRSEFPEVKVIENPDNLGFSTANNRGIRASGGKYVLLLNSDTIVPQGAIGAMASFMDSHPESGAAGCRLICADGTVQASSGMHSRMGITPMLFRLSGISGLIRGERGRRFVRRYLGFLLGPAMRSCLDAYAPSDTPMEMETLSGACLMLRRAMIDQVGLLDENFFMYLEDLDYCIRIKAAGWKLHYLPEITVVHLVGKSSGGRMRHASLRYFQSLFYFYRKHYSPHTLGLARCITFLAFSARLLRSALSRWGACGRQDRAEILKVLRLCWRLDGLEHKPALSQSVQTPLFVNDSEQLTR